MRTGARSLGVAQRESVVSFDSRSTAAAFAVTDGASSTTRAINALCRGFRMCWGDGTDPVSGHSPRFATREGRKMTSMVVPARREWRYRLARGRAGGLAIGGSWNMCRMRRVVAAVLVALAAAPAPAHAAGPVVCGTKSLFGKN